MGTSVPWGCGCKRGSDFTKGDITEVRVYHIRVYLLSIQHESLIIV